MCVFSYLERVLMSIVVPYFGGGKGVAEMGGLLIGKCSTRICDLYSTSLIGTYRLWL